jgi:hypothetical protein
MKKIMMFFVIFGVFYGIGTLQAGEKAPQVVIDLANAQLIKLGTDPVIVRAVKEQNEKGMTLEEIKKMDEKWKAHAGIADYMQVLIDSECGKHLRDLQKNTNYFAEIFVMDSKGANVAMTDKTSDYWQGDEDKFQKSYNGGNGSLFIDEVEFDESAQAYLVQVSVPVVDGYKTIGAVTIGIDVDEIE